jgi:hypothetical protein
LRPAARQTAPKGSPLGAFRANGAGGKPAASQVAGPVGAEISDQWHGQLPQPAAIETADDNNVQKIAQLDSKSDKRVVLRQ